MVASELRKLFRESQFKVMSFSQTYLKIVHRDNPKYIPFVVLLGNRTRLHQLTPKPKEIVQFHQTDAFAKETDLREIRTIMLLAGIKEVENM